MSENQKKDVEMKEVIDTSTVDKIAEEPKAPEVVDPFFGKHI